MKLSEIKTAFVGLMKTVYPETEYHYPSAAVVENYTRPCFCVDLFVDPAEPASRSVRHNTGTFEIKFLPDRVDEYQSLRVVDTLRDLFGYAVKVGDRYVKVLGSEFDYDGTDDNVATLTFTLDWYDMIREPGTVPPMLDVRTRFKVNVEGG